MFLLQRIASLNVCFVVVVVVIVVVAEDDQVTEEADVLM